MDPTVFFVILIGAMVAIAVVMPVVVRKNFVRTKRTRHGVLLTREGRFEEAVTALRLAIELRETDADALWVGLGWALRDTAPA